MTTTFASQFDGMAHPKPKGGDRGGSRPVDTLTHHPDHGPIGSLSAVARELGVSPAALHMHRRRRADFPEPILGTTYALRTVAEFRGAASD